MVSKDLCHKLGLTYLLHPRPYHVQWLSDKEEVKVNQMVRVTFSIGKYIDSVDCDVVPITVCHLLLGQPWQYDHSTIHDGRTNRYNFRWNKLDVTLKPLTPQQILNSSMQKIEMHVESAKG